jgi:hypothetical protein
MNLSELSALLKSMDQSTILPMGLENPHPFSGDEAEVAFEPCGPMQVSTVLAMVSSASGIKMRSCKGCWGGPYGPGTPVHIAHFGNHLDRAVELWMQSQATLAGAFNTSPLCRSPDNWLCQVASVVMECTRQREQIARLQRECTALVVENRKLKEMVPVNG